MALDRRALVATLGLHAGLMLALFGGGRGDASVSSNVGNRVAVIAASLGQAADRAPTAVADGARPDAHHSQPERSAEAQRLAPVRAAPMPAATGTGADKAVSLDLAILKRLDPRYWPAGELTVRPRLLDDLDIQFPPDVAADGSLILVLLINETGRVDAVEVEDSSLSAELAAIAVAAFSGALYRPGELDGAVVGSRLRVEVTVSPASTAQG